MHVPKVDQTEEEKVPTDCESKEEVQNICSNGGRQKRRNSPMAVKMEGGIYIYL